MERLLNSVNKTSYKLIDWLFDLQDTGILLEGAGVLQNYELYIGF